MEPRSLPCGARAVGRSLAPAAAISPGGAGRPAARCAPPYRHSHRRTILNLARPLSALALLALTLGCAGAPPVAAPPRAVQAGPLTIDELLTLPSLTEPKLSPDGKRVLFVVSEPTLAPGGRTRSAVYWIPADGSAAPQVLPGTPSGFSQIQWAPDGNSLLGTAPVDGVPQAWLVPLGGAPARAVTSMPKGVAEPIFSPDGQMIAFASDVDRRPRDRNALAARVIDGLLFRHWTEWRDDVRTHTFVQSLSGGGARDLTPGDFDAPGFSLGGPTPYCFSRDGRTLFFTRGAEKDEAISTDFNVYSVPVDGSAPAKRLTPGGGWDGSPLVSPDGRWLAIRSQATPGFESDLFTAQVIELATGRMHRVGSNVDCWVDEALWLPDSSGLLLVTEFEGSRALWRAPLNQPNAERLFVGNFSSISVDPAARFVVGRYATLRRAGEVARFELSGGARTNGQLRAITKWNDEFFAHKEIGEAESVWIPGAKGAPGARDGKIQGWLVKPPGFKAGTRYPFLLMVHGGPQQAWLDNFGGSMWNPQIFAAHGYVVLALNPHGSTGFGQALTNQISGDWGGAVFEDCMSACDWAVSQGFADPNRMGAFGGSFGGYMVNWFLGHTDRFKGLVSHAGVYNLESMWGVTEELWFPEWELKGLPWNSNQYTDRSPHKYAAKFKTPTLVTHGELDYRVPIGEGIQLYQTLQRLGVPSRFLYYPDEGHWLLKARNRELWIRTVLDWFDRYVKGAKS